MEESDTYLEIYKLIMKVDIINKNNSGLIPKMIPADVATAFPPFILAKIGYV